VILAQILGNCAVTPVRAVVAAILVSIIAYASSPDAASVPRFAAGYLFAAAIAFILCIESYPSPRALEEVARHAEAPHKRKHEQVAEKLTVTSRPDRPALGGIRFRASLANGAEVIASAPDLPWLSFSELREGDLVTATVQIKPVGGSRLSPPNPFSYDGYLFRRGIAGTCRVRSFIKLLEHRSAPPAHEQFLRKLVTSIPPTPELGVILASTVGEDDLLDSYTKEIFRQTGLTHVLVVSGYQVGVCFVLSFLFFRRVLRRCGLILLYVPADAIAASGAFLSACAYGYVTAGALTTVRALLALAIAAVGRMLSRSAHTWRSYGVVFLASLILWPGALFEAGSQLMFAALLGLIAAVRFASVLEARYRLGKKTAALIAASVMPPIFTTPIVLAWFQLGVPLAAFFNFIFAPLLCAVCTTFAGAGLFLFWLDAPFGALAVKLSVEMTSWILCSIEWSAEFAARIGLGAAELQGTTLAASMAGSIFVLIIAVRMAFFGQTIASCESVGTVALTPERQERS